MSEWSMLPDLPQAQKNCIEGNPELSREYYFGHGFKPHFGTFFKRGPAEMTGQVLGHVVGDAIGALSFMVNADDLYPELTSGAIIKAGNDLGAWLDNKLDL
jgi:hypothetical protein